MSRRLGLEAHRAPIGPRDLLGLARQERKVLAQDESGRPLTPLVTPRARIAADEELPADDRQPDAAVRLGVADDALGLAATGHELGLLEHLAPHHDDAAIALAEMLLGAVGDRPLADPGDKVLIHDVRGDPAPGAVPDRAVPVRDAFLRERLLLVRHAVEEPADTQHVLVVLGHSPLEVAAGEETVRPQTGSPDGPQLVGLRLTLQDAPVHEAILELVESDLEMRRRLRPIRPAQNSRPVRV